MYGMGKFVRITDNENYHSLKYYCHCLKKNKLGIEARNVKLDNTIQQLRLSNL